MDLAILQRPRDEWPERIEGAMGRVPYWLGAQCYKDQVKEAIRILERCGYAVTTFDDRDEGFFRITALRKADGLSAPEPNNIIELDAYELEPPTPVFSLPPPAVVSLAAQQTSPGSVVAPDDPPRKQGPGGLVGMLRTMAARLFRLPIRAPKVSRADGTTRP